MHICHLFKNNFASRAFLVHAFFAYFPHLCCVVLMISLSDSSGSAEEPGGISAETQVGDISSTRKTQVDDISSTRETTHMDSSQTYLYNYRFNQDCTCFSISTSCDFRTFTLSPLCEVFRRSALAGGVNVAAMLFQTNYVALVHKSSPYKAILWDEHLGKAGHEIWSRFEILSVLLSREIFVVISEYKVYVYEFAGAFSVLLCLETACNSKGLGVLSPTAGEWVLAVPGKEKGYVHIQQGLDDAHSVNVKISHKKSPTAALGINLDGSLVATASETGTVVKIYSVKQNGQLIHEFRRGSTGTRISSINFRNDSKFIVVGSSSETVHIFRLSTPHTNTPSGIYGKVAEWAAALTPAESSASSSISSTPVVTSSLANYYFHERAFAMYRIPDIDCNLRVLNSSPICGPIVCFSKEDASHIYIVHYNGLMYHVKFDELATIYGQECVLIGASSFFQARPDFVVETQHKHVDDWEVI